MDSKTNHLHRRYVLISVTSFEENLKELQVLELKWKMIKAELVCKLFEEQDTVFRSYYKGQVGQQ